MVLEQTWILFIQRLLSPERNQQIQPQIPNAYNFITYISITSI